MQSTVSNYDSRYQPHRLSKTEQEIQDDISLEKSLLAVVSDLNSHQQRSGCEQATQKCVAYSTLQQIAATEQKAITTIMKVFICYILETNMSISISLKSMKA